MIYQTIQLHQELKNKTYHHGGYEHFKISDPKPRDIHKASVRDRLLHHALHRKLYPFFDRTFIADSYSCRVGKGTHRAMDAFRSYAGKCSRNHTRTCWVLKCDIKKFFASIDHEILHKILRNHVPDRDILWLLGQTIGSFCSRCTFPGIHQTSTVVDNKCSHRGLPLGSLTSQLLVNVYMNEFDQFVKHKLKIKYYIRYADDFVVLSHDKQHLQEILRYIEVFLKRELRLGLHPNKISIETLASGVDFLEWVHFPDHRVLRTATRRRMFKKFAKDKESSKQSYLGLLKHGNARKLQRSMLE